MLNLRKLLFIVIVAISSFLYFFFFKSQNPYPLLPVIAIASYGPHSSLNESIRGIQEELDRLGLKKNEHIHFEVSDVSFESSLISQMLSKLKSSKPKILVTLTTPVSQVAKNTIKNIPIVFSCITDPVEGGLLKNENEPDDNITGTTDKQDLNAFLHFAKELLPNAKTVGILYANGEANDAALVKMMTTATAKANMNLVAISVEHSRDISVRMQAFKNKVDFIYVGVSGPIQPALPTIAAEANKMKIPVFNSDADAVKNHQVLASFGVNYYEIGVNTASIIDRILQGEQIKNIKPINPSTKSHIGYISKIQAGNFNISLPQGSKNLIIVE